MKASTREDLERAAALLAKIEKLPGTIAAREAEAAATLEKRRAAVARIGALEADLAEALPKLQAALDWAEAGCAAAQESLRKATEEARAARLALVVLNRDTESGVTERGRFCLPPTTPELTKRSSFSGASWTGCEGRGAFPTISAGAVRNLITWTKTATVESNEAAVKAAMRHCQDAIAELEAMRLRPEVDAARIATFENLDPDDRCFRASERRETDGEGACLSAACNDGARRRGGGSALGT